MTDRVAAQPTLPVVDAEAAQVLADGLSRRQRRSVRIVGLRVRPLAEYSSHPITRLVATLEDGSQLPVVFKTLQPHPAKDVRREVLLYERVLTHGQVGAPSLYASQRDEARGHYWLFLEDVGSLRLQWCDVEDWDRAFRWLAGMHAAYAGREAQLATAGCLGQHGADFYAGLVTAATRSLRDHGASREAARLERLSERWLASATALLGRQPRTLVHGDLSCHNVMVLEGRTRALDWEWAGIGPAAWDVAKLLAGWGPRKRRLLKVYLAELRRCGTTPSDRDGFAAAVAQCEALQVLWYLWWWIGPCQDPAVVGGMLGRVESRWRMLDQGEG